MATKPRTRSKKTPARPRTATADLRQALPIRPLGPRSPGELACARAALANATACLPIPVRAWHALPDGHAYAQLADGTLIVHTADRAPLFTAYPPACTYGAHHEHTVTSPAGLTEARTHAATCTTPHITDEQRDALTRVPGTQPAPIPAKVHPLGEGLHRVRAAAEETTELSARDITEGLSARTAADQPKEHPQP